jgi:hypothetical protein
MSPLTKEQRAKMIEQLCEVHHEALVEDSRIAWGILKRGFPGYLNMTDEELRAEWADRSMGEEGQEP